LQRFDLAAQIFSSVAGTDEQLNLHPVGYDQQHTHRRLLVGAIQRERTTSHHSELLLANNLAIT
jgi:hypothetical protein